jgi:hypothetical protein
MGPDAPVGRRSLLCGHSHLSASGWIASFQHRAQLPSERAGRTRNELFTCSVNAQLFLRGHAMSSLNIRLHKTFQKSAEESGKPKLRIVSNEPFSPVVSFLLGMSAGLTAATGLFVIFFR